VISSQPIDRNNSNIKLSKFNKKDKNNFLCYVSFLTAKDKPIYKNSKGYIQVHPKEISQLSDINLPLLSIKK